MLTLSGLFSRNRGETHALNLGAVLDRVCRRFASKTGSRKPIERPPYRRKIFFENLEPRLLMSADFNPVAPMGTMIHQSNQSGNLAAPNSTASYTLSLDAGQKISVVLDTADPDLRATIELYDTDGTSLLASATAGNPGEMALIDSLLADDAGDYRLDVRNATGEGDFNVDIFLNATVEIEVLGSTSNNDLANAQDLAPSAIALPGGGLRYAAVGTTQSAEADFFRLDLALGESASFGLAAMQAGAGDGLRLELLDAGGNLIAIGDPSAKNFDQVIAGYAVPAAGTYYLRVSGNGGEDYSLLALRETVLDIEPNDSLAQAQALSPLDEALGSLGEGASLGGSAIRVAVLGGGNAVAQLNDDSYYDFTATSVSAYEIDTVEELNNYDVVLLGATYSDAIAPALNEWVKDGHGVVGSGWMFYYDGLDTPPVNAALDEVIPVNLNSYRSYTYYPTISIADSTHPVTQGVTSFTNYYNYAEYGTAGIDAGAVTLGTVDGYPAVVVNEIEGGRGVYLAPVYPWYNWGTGMADRLLEQAVAWAATGGLDRFDNYRLAVNAGDALVIGTSTPGDGLAEPDNNLDPLLQLYDPSGILVASNDNGAADGRNALINYTVPTGAAGAYRVQVSRVAGAGAYTLEVQGAGGSLSASPIAVTGSSVANGAALTSFPAAITLTFSEAVANASLVAGDLTVNGSPAVDATLIGANQVRFGIAALAAGDGTYDVQLNAGVLTDLAGEGNTLFNLSFTLDTTGPSVTSSIPAAGGLLPPGTNSLSFTFDEALYTGALGTEDVQLYEALSATYIAAQNLYYDSGTHTVTVGYASLPEGNYSTTLFANEFGFRDVAGNTLSGGDFTMSFSVDAASSAYPTPLEAKQPLGSLIHDPLAVGAFHATGDVDDYTLNLDGNQTLGVALFAQDPTFLGRIEVLDPLGASLGTNDAGSYGGLAFLNTLPVAAGGTYTIRVTSLDGAGRYELGVLLNAATEEEMLGLGSNDDLGTAQNISYSFIDLGGGVSRGAVYGDLQVLGEIADWYQFTPTAGDLVTAVLNGGSAAQAAALRLDLYDDNGDWLATGTADALNTDLAIRDLEMLSSGTFYVRVSGGVPGEYGLVVTRNSAFEGEANDRLDQAQDIGATGRVLGHGDGVIDVAILGGDGGEGGSGGVSQLVSQLNDSQWDGNADVNLHIQARQVTAGQIDTLAELSRYDVVFIGGAGSHYDLLAIAPVLRQWVEAGGGLVASASLIDQVGANWGDPIADIDAIVPVDTSGYATNQWEYTDLTITDGSHPVTDGVGNFYVYSIQWATPDAGASVLGTYYNGTPAVVVGAAGAGRGVYLGPRYADSSGELGSGFADRLVEQAVAWAAGQSQDNYVVHASAGDTLTIRTQTPGDGAGEPFNDLDPAIFFFDAAGSQLASDDNGAADGRNGWLQFTVSEAGDYVVQVRVVSGGGDYLLTVEGATGAQSEFAVVAVQPEDNADLASYPATYRVTLSHGVLLTTASADDLTVNGIAAAGVTVIDGNTLLFDISNADIGPDQSYAVHLAAGALQSLSGTSLQEYFAHFTTDATPPWVDSTTLAEGGVVGTAPFAIGVTFSEAMDAAVLGTDDVTLVDDQDNSYAATGLVYDAGSNSVELTFGSLPEGAYTLTLLSSSTAFRDRAGLPLDADADGASGPDYVLHFAVDASTQAYPVPLAPVQPGGSLIYDPAPTGQFHAVGDQDSYTLELEAGQVLTVVLGTDSSGLIGRVQLLDPFGEIVGAGEAATGGADAVLQTATIAESGTYTIRVTAVQGQGRYQVQAILNAAREAEIAGGDNGALASAQNIDASFIAIGAAASRGAVRGELAGAGDADWYRFSLQAGVSSTIALVRDDRSQPGSVALDLYSAAGDWIASGQTDSTSLDAYIKDFAAGANAAFYVRVSGDAASGYSLLVTRGADFGLGLPGLSQDISLTNTVLGGLGGGGAGGIRVAVVASGWGGYYDNGLLATVNQLNDDTWFDFSATLVSPGAVDTLAELQAYDAVVIGGTDYDTSQFNSYAGALVEYVSQGGGLVMTGFGIYSARYLPEPLRSDFNAIIPVNSSGYEGYLYSPTITPVGSHPIVAGVAPHYIYDVYSEYPTVGPQVDAGATLLAQVGSTPVAAAMEVGGAGRSVYLGTSFAQPWSQYYSYSALRSGSADRMLEQAVAWAAIERDSYTFVANSGDPLVIETSTPGDGSGEPGNNLDISIAFYAPDGSLIDPADYTETSPDGRNVRIEFTAPAGGYYRVELRAENGTAGAYVLTASGSTANIDTTPPTVISGSLADGDIIPPGDLTYAAIFSEELATAGLGVDDVILTNTDTGAVLGASLGLFSYEVAGSTLTLTCSNLDEGNYSLALVADGDGFRDTQGNGLDGNADGFGGDNYVVHFSVDAAGATALPAVQQVAPAGSLVYDPPVSGTLHNSSDVDDYTITLDAGQKASVRLTPQSAALRAQVQLIAPDGSTVLGTASAGAAGMTTLLQNVPLGAEGAYTVRVSQMEGAGEYELQVVLNAQLESEAWGGTANDTRTSAEDIDGSAVVLAGAADRLAVLGAVSAGNDWYSFTLAAGQAASLAVTRTDQPAGSGLALELYDGSGTRLASGIADAGNVDQSISGFIASGAGMYYARVSADLNLPYSLVVTRSADFGLESSERAQDISPTGRVLGALGGTGLGTDGAIRVAVLNSGGAGTVVSQLNDDSYFDFSATSVGYSQIDTLAELANYDVVMLGDSSTAHGEIAAIAPALRQWVEAGGGVVGTGWVIYTAGSNFGTPVADIDAILPVDTTVSHLYQYNPLIDITATDHAVTTGVADFYPGYYVEYSPTADAGATVLGYAGSQPTVVVGNAGAGRGVYLGPIYMQSLVSNQSTGSADRLLEQAVAWAAGDRTDSYAFQATAGQELDIRTFTPGDGAGAPANILDARLELYDPAGILVASDDNGAADGRNARIQHSAAGSGRYEVRVISGGVSETAASGDYFLQVNGATLVAGPAPQVVAASPIDGKRLTTPPASLTLDLSEGLLVTSIGVEDLAIDGGATVTGVELLDGDTVRFTLDVPNVEGTYHYTLLGNAISDLQGTGNIAHSGSFTLDTTPPSVVSQNPLVESNSPFSTWSVTFSEALNPSTVQTSDFVLRNPGNASIGINSATVSGDGLTVTVGFSDQYTDGNYTLTVGPEIYDVAGNRMDQDLGTAGNQSYVGTVRTYAPDLQPASISVTLPDGSALPADGVALGSQVRVTWTVRNEGSDAARATSWYDSLWLSTDTNSAGDTHLGTFHIDVDPGNTTGLPAGEQYTMSGNVTLPLNDSFNAGTYHIRIQTDDYYGYGYNYQRENNEGNNALYSSGFTTLVPPLPDLTVSDVVIPAVVEAGKGIAVSWIVHNQGGGNADGPYGYWYDRIVLSTDLTFGNGDDVYLGEIYYYDDIPAGGQLARSATPIVPIDRTGTWNVLVKSDYYNHLYERTNEGNNVGVSAGQVQVVIATEDLTPTALSAPESAVLGGTIDVSWTVQNAGSGPTYGDWHDRLVLSTDQIFGNGDDIYLTEVAASSAPTVRPLAAGAQYARSVENIALPLNPGLSGGAYYLLLKSDYYGNEPELNEANNVFARAITMALPQIADLTVSNVLVPVEGVQSGDTVTVNFTLNNQGDGAAANFHNHLYLSGNGSSLDHYVGDYYFDQTLAAGASVAVEKAITIPLYNPGDWYVVVVSDPVYWWSGSYGNVYEHTNEGNNSASSAAAMHAPLPALPDLVVSNIVAPLEALAGEDITITWTISNQGTAASGPWTDRLYLSTDDGVSDNIHVGDFAFEGTLAAGASITRTQTYHLNATLDGQRRVVVYTDYWGQVNETHQYQGNNRAVDNTTISVTFPPLPNLQVTALTPPSDPASGTGTVVSWVVTNNGTGATSTPVWYDEVHLSLDTIWGNGDDTYMGRAVNTNYLPLGEMYANSVAISIPKGLNGDYYFLVKTDVYNNVFEDQFEGDNVAVSALTHIALTSPPDLRVQTVEAQNLAFSGQSMSVSWTVVNDDRFASGRTVENSWYDRLVMSEDAEVGNGDDRNMGDFWHVGALDPGESYSVTRNITLPIGVIGDFYFFVVADRANHVYEHGFEFNNNGVDMLPDDSGPETTTVLLTPPPDLEVLSVTAPASAEAGHTYNAFWRVANYGATATPNNYWTDRIYLSSDGVLDAGDIHLGDRGHWGVLGVYEEDIDGNAIAGYYDTSASFTLPFDITGDYRLIVKTDAGSQVFEGFEVPGPDGEENNVTASAVMAVVSRPADLVVDSVAAPDSGEAGRQISVSWTVRNAGTGDSVANAWFDRVLVSFDDVLGDADDIMLSDFGRGGVLGAGASYTRSETVTLPFSLDDGDYRLYVRADVNNNVHESDNANNSAYDTIYVDRETPDLQIVSLDHAAEGMAGLPLNISWRVENQGANQTNVNTWHDEVYLSLDQVLSGGDILLGSRYRNSGLAIGAGYDASTGFSPPTSLATNDYFVIVRTDKNNSVTEGAAGEANNVRVSDTTVHVEANIPIPPDLTVVTVDAPPEAISGQTMQVSWTVRNDGPGRAESRPWYDAVYLSRDGVLDRGADIYLGYAYHAGLDAGESYTQTLDVSVPFGQSGPFYVFVAADAGRHIAESNELNNVAQDAAFTMVSLAPPADLVVGTITLPDNGVPGRSATISFSVNNQGTNPALGSWTDSIYLSADDTWDINDALFGVAHHSGTVAGGSSYGNLLTATLPGLTPGDYHVIIRSDIRNHIPESDETNNIAGSLDQVALDVDELTLGVPSTYTLGSGQAVYYKFDVGAGETVRLVLDSLGTDIANELYVRYGSMPTRGQFDFASRDGFTADPELVIPTSQAGTYYVLAYGQYAPGNPEFNITARIIPFSVTSADATVVGNAGDVTLRIEGARFGANTEFSLVAPDGAVIKAHAVYLDNSSEAYATFSLFRASVGTYDVVAEQIGTNPDGSTFALASFVLADAISVEQDNEAAVFLNITGPTAIPPNRTNLFTLNYVNDGGADVMAPLIILESFSVTPMGLSASNMHTSPIQILAASYDGPMDMLRPGARYSVPVAFHSAGAGQLDMRAGRILADDVRLIEDWGTIESSVRPSSIGNDEWDAFWGRIKPLMGATWGEYVQVLNSMMLLVSDPGHPIRDVRDIFARMYLQNPDYVPYAAMSGEVRDSEDDTPLADVQMAAYLIHDDGRLEYKASALSDADGRFTFNRLAPAVYKIVAIGRALDMDRNGQVDLTTPQFTLGDTEPGNAGVIYIQPLTIGADNDSNPVLTRDADGITHMVWNRDGLVWHAWFDTASGQWRDAAALSSEQSYGPAMAASSKLFDGARSGVVVAWQQGSGNDSEIWYAVARAKAGGGFEWSSPVQLTNDDSLDAAPQIIVGDNGLVMFTHLKRDGDIQDDTDIYYDIFALSETDFLWPVAVDIAAAEAGAGTGTPIQTEGVSVAYGRQWKFGPWDVFGTEAELVLALTGQVGENNCKATLGAQGQISGSFKGSNIRSTITGNGAVTAEWGVNQAARDWMFNGAKASVGASAQFDWRYGLSTLLSKIPHPAVTSAHLLYSLAVAIGHRVGLDFEDGITFGGGVNFSVLEWKMIQPFPEFVWPDGIFEVDVSGNFGLYAQLDVAATGDSVRLQGDLTVNLGIKPEFKIKSVTGNITFSGNIGWMPFNEVFSVTLYNNESLDLLDMPVQTLDDYVPLFDPAALIGTGNAYGTNHVLADVSGDLTSDSAMSLASDDGVIFGAWTHMANVDPALGQIGWEVMAVEYGSAWSAPVALPGSLGVNSFATAAVDGQGKRMVIWTHADSSGLSDAPTADDYLAALDANDVVYAVYDEGTDTWGNMQSVAATLGMDSDLSVSHDADGKLVMSWVVLDAAELRHLMTATWDGNGWGTPVELLTGASIMDPAMERLGGGLIVVWEEDADPDPNETDKTLHYSIYDGAAWSAGALFDPIAMATGLALSAGQPIAAAADTGLQTEAVFPPFPVPEECLKCKPEDIKRIRESAPECIAGGGTQVTFDEKTCTEKTIVYRPCVVVARDPNDIIGPTGFGEEKWTAAKSAMGYTIRFENAADATAPAQQVVITQQLDADLDWRTFRVDDFGFGDQLIELDGRSAFYQARLDYTDDPARGYFLDVAAAIDVTSGIVTWTLTTIDPDTGDAPRDASIGFLPVNDTVYDENHHVVGEPGTGRGEGFVSYSIKALRAVESGTVVDAEARIVFDTEEPIDTPFIFNTLDAGVPESHVAAFANATTPLSEFLVSWGGEDDAAGSGVRDYTIFVSVDGGDFNIWQADTTLTEAIYLGATGHTYGFFSTARDNAGNEEAKPVTADASITVGGAFGALSGVKFEDTDGDGQRDAGEAGREGWTLFLDADNDGSLDVDELSTVSAGDGSFGFTDLAPGAYIVREVQQSGWMQTLPTGDGSQTITVVSDQTATGVDFGNFRLAQIDGRKFNDVNANGLQDVGETGLAGWVIQMDKGGDGSIEATAITDLNGDYRFADLGPGSYRITEVLQAGWLQTGPAGGAYTVVTTSGASLGGKDFANVAAASISGVKFEDVDGDGQRDAGEAGLEGWTIFIDADADGSLDSGERSLVTDANGAYRFDNLLPGTYVVAEVMQDGWTQTSPGTGPEPESLAQVMTLSGMDVVLSLPEDVLVEEELSTEALSSNQMADAMVGLDAFRDDVRFAGIDGSGVTTVVIDTGIDLNHAWFGADADHNGIADRIVYSWDFADGDPDASDYNGHGSHVASLIGGGDALYGGVAQGADLIALKVFSDSGAGYFSYLEQALQWVVIHAEEFNVGVINLSLGDGGNWDTAIGRYGLGDELAALENMNVLVAAAAGNNYFQFGGDMGVAYPAADPAVLAVGAVWSGSFGGPVNYANGAADYTTGADRLAAFVQRDGELLDVLAPGTRMVGANYNGGSRTMFGTSQASAYMAGVATLAQDLALEHLGRRLSLGEFTTLLADTSVRVNDGDDENDNVANTGLDFARIDMLALANAILGLGTGGGGAGGAGSGAGDPDTGLVASAATHKVTLAAGEDVIDQDFGNFELIDISGTVFDDFDGNGQMNGADSGLAGWTVYLDGDGDGSLDAGEVSALSGVDGAYHFADLGPGSYRVSLLGRDGWVPTSDSFFDVFATSGALETRNFGVNQTPTADPIAPQVLYEGQTLSLTVVGHDADGDSLSYALISGPGIIDPNTGAFQFLAVDGYATHEVGVRVSDGMANSFFDVFFDITVGNVVPLLGLTGPATGTAGQTYTLGLSRTDPGDDTLTGWTIDWGDGSTSDHAGDATSASHVYAAAGNYGISASASDEDGSYGVSGPAVAVSAASLRIAAFTQSDSGFHLNFNRAVDRTVLNLFSSADNPMGAADLVLSRSGDIAPIRGSLVLDEDGRGATFVKTNGVLAAGDYTLTLSSRSDGWKDSAGGLLDGNADGTTGDNYVRPFSVASSTSAILSVGEFSAGPGVDFKAAGATGSGLPVTIANAVGATGVSFKLAYDPDLFSVSGVSLGAALPAGSSFTADYATSGVVNVSVTFGAALGSGTLDVVRILGTVPMAAIDIYGSKQVLDLFDVSLNGGSMPVRADDGLHVNAYAGDTTGLANYTTLDQQQLDRVIRRLDTGFGAFPLADPIVIADVNNTKDLNSADSLLLARKVAGLASLIPSIPVGISPLTAVGPDPLVDIPRDLTAQAGGLVTVPVRLDTAAYLESAQLRIAWDAGQLKLVEVRRGSLTEDFQWFVSEQRTGSLTVDMSRLAQMDGGQGTLLELVFRVDSSARGSVGVDLQMARLNDTRLTLNPAPQIGADPTDGLIQVTTSRGGKATVAWADTGSSAVIDFDKRYSGFALVDSRGGESSWLSDWLKDNKSKGKKDFLRIKPKAMNAPTRL